MATVCNFSIHAHIIHEVKPYAISVNFCYCLTGWQFVNIKKTGAMRSMARVMDITLCAPGFLSGTG